MDAFYASVEQRDNPALSGRPLAVGGSAERGVVAAASYEARVFGIHSAMSSRLAARKCPDLIFVKPNFEKYRAVSQQIRNIFFEYTDLVEPLSLDEAYLDVSENKKGIATATRIAREIRARIKAETELNASAGISINKFLAKVASDINKPNGQKTIMPDEALDFLEQLPVGKFYGIGAKTAEKMKRLGIHHGRDLKKWDLALLTREFGKSGHHYYHIVRGLQKSTVKPDRVRKSIGAERTFSSDLSHWEEQEKALMDIADKLWERIAKAKKKAKTLTLKYKFSDFSVHTRSLTLEKPLDDPATLKRYSRQLLAQIKLNQALRLMGLSVSNFTTDQDTAPQQLTLSF